MWADAALVLGAYLLGSVPHLAILARLRRVKLEGDFHAGLRERAGLSTAIIGVLGEFFKGALPVLAGRALGFDIAVVALAGLAAVAGQMWPVFSRFDGEKGNSIGIAMAAALAPVASLVAVVVIVISLVIRTLRRLKTREGFISGPPSHSLPLGMAIAFLVYPLAAWALGDAPEVVWCGAALWVMIMVRRLTAGLGRDLKTAPFSGGKLLDRLLYDRPAEAWRR
jgi:glycerol-3-phosphate acyltransferase PlsY